MKGLKQQFLILGGKIHGVLVRRIDNGICVVFEYGSRGKTKVFKSKEEVSKHYNHYELI